jgi:hypothetical protein
MTFQKINSKRVAIVLVATLFSAFCFAQEAENIFKKQYSKLSFVFQPSILQNSEASNNDGSTYPSMEFEKDFSFQFGVYYNFAQAGNFNFKTGLIAKEFVPKFELNISDEDIGNGLNNHLSGFDPYSQFILSIPIKIDYYLPLSTKTNIVFSTGLNFNYITGLNEETITSVSIGYADGGSSKDIFSTYSAGSNNLNLSYELSLGLNYKTNFALFDLSFYVNNTITTDYVYGNYDIYNLTVSPDKSGTFVLKSNFYGLSLNVAPKKGWLKKK